ncbi:hypothetical protein K2Z83_21655 [Oscillochloris sp. ZM17-4]|uniref:hypothetical protein n=1 Tax=Oscillochloris sp. ZM17-4 TaxID=2866714 RepID=UPI001C734C44|nr:hypothetical protein [Oscillochloris sp. ZM17-4]MBX0330276.1 hypothetical protein [Oscillochloris sp. ZM17-4]
MQDLLIAPGAPYFLGALAASLLAGLGLALMPPRPLAAGPATPGISPTARLAAGQIAGVALASLLITVVLAGDVRGSARTLLLAAALGAYLGLGLALPRRPEVRRQREAAALRRLTPGMIAFVRVGLGSFESPTAILSRYVAQGHPRIAPMRQLVAEAIQLGQDRRLRPFAALALAARPRGCRELTDVAEALAQSESEGASVETVLAAQQATLELILQSEFKRELRRRTMYLLLMVAVSLVVGILINLLWIMTRGGAALTQMG